MRKGGGSQKGAAFERQICKQLSLWWTDGARDDVFWRTAGSGSRATNRAKRGAKTAGAYGDITYTDACGADLLKLFCFELKRGYSKLDVLDVVDTRSITLTTLERFWLQARESAINAGGELTLPAVIFRRNKRATCIMLNKVFFRRIAASTGKDKLSKIQVNILQEPVYIMRFDDWLDFVDPVVIRKMVVEYGL